MKNFQFDEKFNFYRAMKRHNLLKPISISRQWVGSEFFNNLLNGCLAKQENDRQKNGQFCFCDSVSIRFTDQISKK